MYQKKKIIESLKAQNARLKKAASDQLGLGYWGLDVEENNITHEEIIFLFARIFQVIGFESITSIRTEFPDCKAIKEGREYLIEFEPYLSNFKDHIHKKDDLSKCNYIVCWGDDLERHSHIKKQISENKIEIIELKAIWQETKTKKPPRPFYWTKEDFERMKVNKLKVLSAFITEEKYLLTTKEIGKIIEKKSRGLGGSLKGFSEHKKRDWIVKNTPTGWKFNERYRDVIRKVLSEFEMI